MDTIFWEAVGKMKPLMNGLKGSEARSWSNYSNAPRKGVYVLYDNGEPIYGGDTAGISFSSAPRIEPRESHSIVVSVASVAYLPALSLSHSSG